MTAFAAIDIDNGASTPVGVTFNPSSIDPNGVAHLYADGDNGFDSRNHISLGVKLPKNGSSVARVTAKVVIPVMSADDVPVKIGECIANVEFVIPKRASDDDRANLLAFLHNLVNTDELIAAVTKLESIY